MRKKTLKQTANDIKALNIQGASEVRKAAVKALQHSIETSKAKSVKEFRKELKKNMLLLFQSRPTEPGMRAAISIILKQSALDLPLPELKKVLAGFCANYEASRKHALHKMAEYGSRLIPKKGIVFTHCHSHSVEAILKLAWKKKILKQVYCTETRPRYQGRITAAKLSKAGIPVTMVVDSAAAQFIHHAHLFLTGADAILSDGSVVNKIGTYQLSLAASKNNVPHLVATGSGKFDPLTVYGFQEEIEERDWQEVWMNKPKKVKIRNPAFDITPSEMVKDIITEKGVFGSEAFSYFMYDELKLDEKTEKDVSLSHLLKGSK